MFILTYHAKPSENYKGGPVGGAYINCYIKTTTSLKADRAAKKEIKKLNWDILEKTFSKKVTRAYYHKDSPGLEFYDQAMIDKEVFVFYTYPARKKRRVAKKK